MSSVATNSSSSAAPPVNLHQRPVQPIAESKKGLKTQDLRGIVDGRKSIQEPLFVSLSLG